MTQNKFPRQSEKHSSAAQREVKGKPVEILRSKHKKKLYSREKSCMDFLEELKRLACDFFCWPFINFLPSHLLVKWNRL